MGRCPLAREACYILAALFAGCRGHAAVSDQGSDDLGTTHKLSGQRGIARGTAAKEAPTVKATVITRLFIRYQRAFPEFSLVFGAGAHIATLS